MNYSGVAQAKAVKSTLRMLIDGVMAGFMVAIGGYASQLATAAGLPKLVAAAVFPVGIIMVILTGSELFTGNCLMAGSALTGRIRYRDLIRVWGLSYVGNLGGALLTAASVRIIGSSAAYQEVATQAVEGKLAMGIGEVLIRAILCNVLVCLSVWMAIYADTTAGKILSAFVPVFVFVLCGFEHSVANMFFFPVGGAGNLMSCAGQILIVTVGNIIGGGLVGCFFETREMKPQTK